MKYALLLYDDPTNANEFGTPEMDAEMQQWFAFTEELSDAGKNLGGEALTPVETATTVRVRDGKTVTADGPFAETKETLGGFYLIEAADLDEAIAWAAKIPSAPSGSVEVRPIMEFDG
ncbi:MAG: YciI family protein [Ilumatobacter sp.]|uniref:YciI family protein n=1 Tax=Ilumatobacter sp. TaxID=1967498 RepID=UPI003C7222DE